MIEKICSHCGATLLVGLNYCPGCLLAIEGRLVGDLDSESMQVEDASYGADSLFADLDLIWANLTYPLKSAYCRMLGRPDPPTPTTVPKVYRGPVAHSPYQKLETRPTLSLSPGYIRVVCPKCQSALRAPLGFSPSEAVTCGVCMHEFPGSFAAEFRTGADLECLRCGVTTFCVTGDKVTICPNCRFSTERVTAKTRIKLGVLGTLAFIVFGSLLAHAVMTQTTTQFIVGTCAAVVASVLGFVTLVALGF